MLSPTVMSAAMLADRRRRCPVGPPLPALRQLGGGQPVGRLRRADAWLRRRCSRGPRSSREIIGERYFEHSIGIAAGAIGAAVAAACIVPLHNRVHRWAERRFQKPLIRLREGLPECVADLRDTGSVGQIAEAVMKRVEAGVRSTREALLLAEHGKLAVAGTRGTPVKAVASGSAAGMSRAPTIRSTATSKTSTFPLRVRLCIETSDEPETIGWLLLGPRPDGSFFGKDEREALEHIAGAVARALHIAQLRERKESLAEERLSALEQLMDKVASALNKPQRRALR